MSQSAPSRFGGLSANSVATNTCSAAVLDLDGTLYAGAVGVDWLRALIDAGVCEQAAGRRVFEILDEHRSGAIDFPTMAARAYAAFASALAGTEVETAEAIARTVWACKREQLFAFVPELIACLREHGFEPMLISGSPIEMVELVADELGISVARGAVFAREAGRYTGTVELSSGTLGEKTKILAKLLTSIRPARELPLEHCFALGNSLTDAKLFECVGVPLAFEPDAELLVLAQAHGWRVATRHDVLATTRSLLDTRASALSSPILPPLETLHADFLSGFCPGPSPSSGSGDARRRRA
jgi:phosphoserine phosphatase